MLDFVFIFLLLLTFYTSVCALSFPVFYVCITFLNCYTAPLESKLREREGEEEVGNGTGTKCESTKMQ